MFSTFSVDSSMWGITSQNIPDCNTILGWVEAFRTAGSMMKRKPPGLPVSVHTPENVERVKEVVFRSLRCTARHQALALQLLKLHHLNSGAYPTYLFLANMCLTCSFIGIVYRSSDFNCVVVLRPFNVHGSSQQIILSHYFRFRTGFTLDALFDTTQLDPVAGSCHWTTRINCA